MAGRSMFYDALTARRPTVQAGHVRFRPGFIDKNQARGLYVRDGLLPTPPLIGYVLAFLLRRLERLFFSVRASTPKARNRARSLS